MADLIKKAPIIVLVIFLFISPKITAQSNKNNAIIGEWVPYDSPPHLGPAEGDWDTFKFFPNGDFAYYFPGSDYYVLSKINGKYRLSNDTLYITIKSYEQTTGGIIRRFSGDPNISEWGVDSTKDVVIKQRECEEFFTIKFEKKGKDYFFEINQQKFWLLKRRLKK